ncbi:shootin-1-like isoform X4 [Crassostrea angulata]|uniref:shootin-1-like isoform X4 n=1 Tax=Magallana angulata TaxID=2784310 RepID=UPI0022B1F7DA|nr:shootin-1-like isoform X4 [Crassostrea angulata]
MTDHEEFKMLQERYDVLKELSSQVLVRYDELLYKFLENEKVYNSTVHKLKLRESQLKEMKKLIQPAISEYERMKLKYEIEFNCRTQAEMLATKITTQNKELKRQSKMLLDLQGPNPPDITKMNLDLDLDEKEDSMEEYRQEQSQKIQKLEEELIAVQQELGSLREDLGIEKDHSSKWKTKFEEMKESRNEAEKVVALYKEAMKDLSKVSEEAVREYEALQQKYELEKQCRSGAEQFATEIRIQNEAMKKQSMILLTEAASDPKLMLALHEVEQLTQELETQKQKYEQEIKELKKAAENEDKMFEELDNSAYVDEIRHLEAKVKQFEDQYNKLQDRYIALEARFEEATRPPPPPPPPPPPSLTTKSKGFLSKFKREKKKPTGVQNVPQNDTFSKAMSEMMERINSGKPLTPGARAPPRRRPSETVESETGAMKELNNILKKMKRTQSEADMTSMAGGEAQEKSADSEPAFAFTLKKRMVGSEAREESTADTPLEPAFAFTLKKRSDSVDASVPEKKEEQPEFLTPSFKLKGGRLKQLLNPMDEENN